MIFSYFQMDTSVIFDFFDFIYLDSCWFREFVKWNLDLEVLFSFDIDVFYIGYVQVWTC